MPVLFTTTSTYTFQNVSFIYARNVTPGPATINIRDGAEDGELLLVADLGSLGEEREFDFPARGSGRNFDPDNGVFIEIIGDCQVTVAGAN